MRFTVLVVVLVTMLALPAMAYDWVQNPDNDYMYTLVDNNTSWQDAENKAIALGGHLVTIRSQTENDWVFNYVLSTTTSGVYGAWIGMYQLPGSPEPAGGWVWSSGEPVLYTHWQTTTGEPNNYQGLQEDWAKMYVRQHDWDEIVSFWNDTWFYEPSRPDTVGVVEAVPEPTSFLAISGGMIGLIGLIRLRKTWRKHTQNPRRNPGVIFFREDKGLYFFP